MKTIKVQTGQTLVDIAIRHYGSAEGLVPLCQLNNIALTHELEPGQTLAVDEAAIVDFGVVDYFESRGLDIGTGHVDA